MSKFGRAIDEVRHILDNMPDAWQRLDKKTQISLCDDIVMAVYCCFNPDLGIFSKRPVTMSSKEEKKYNSDFLLSTMEATEWAEEFLKVHPKGSDDPDIMLNWFASAIMTGYDKGLEVGAKLQSRIN